MNRDVQLSVVPIPGLVPDSLGYYLASLGLLRVLARKWSDVRLAWLEGIPQIVGGPAVLDAALDELVQVATNKSWTPYERKWDHAQKESTKAKSGRKLALWLAEAEEQRLELFNAHAVPAARVNFNPLLGSGGNAGKRIFSEGWSKAVDALSAPSAAGTEERAKGKQKRINALRLPSAAKDLRRTELEAFLLGKSTSWLLEKLNAASWFSNANKLYNSGQKPYREGQLSPWAMALACEGLAFFGGGASRRLGARARATGAFPFVTHSAAPEVQCEAGHDLAEVWAPIWNRPMTLPEIRTLFARGRAEVHGRGVQTPSAFATAIWRRGVDAGISEFRRFVLGRTTSANTFEPRFAGIFYLPEATNVATQQKRAGMSAMPDALERIVNLIDRLPRDQKKGDRWQFVGLRGPLEATLLRAAADPQNPDATRKLLDAAVAVLDRVDRNRSFREKRIAWQPLPIHWLPALFADEPPSVEARLAVALVSGFPRLRPFTLYRFGVELIYGRYEHTGRPPARWVWGPGSLSRLLSAVLLRRTLDWEAKHKEQQNSKRSDSNLLPASLIHVKQWLHGRLDEDLLARWISRLALFEWRFVANDIYSGLAFTDQPEQEVDAGLMLFGLFQPLFDWRPVKKPGDSSKKDLLDPESGARTPAAARTLANLIRVGQLDTAIRFAGSRFSMAGTPLAKLEAPWRFADPDRLLASMLFTVKDLERAMLVQRWLRPQRHKGESAYV